MSAPSVRVRPLKFVCRGECGGVVLKTGEYVLDELNGQYYCQRCGCVLQNNVIDPHNEARRFTEDDDKGGMDRAGMATGDGPLLLMSVMGPQRGPLTSKRNQLAMGRVQTANTFDRKLSNEMRSEYDDFRRGVIDAARVIIHRDREFLATREDRIMNEVQDIMEIYLRRFAAMREENQHLRNEVKGESAAVFVFLAVRRCGWKLTEPMYVQQRNNIGMTPQGFRQKLEQLAKLMELQPLIMTPPTEDVVFFIGTECMRARPAPTFLAQRVAKRLIDCGSPGLTREVCCLASLRSVLVLLPVSERSVLPQILSLPTSSQRMISDPEAMVSIKHLSRFGNCSDSSLKEQARAIEIKNLVASCFNEALAAANDDMKRKLMAIRRYINPE